VAELQAHLFQLPLDPQELRGPVTTVHDAAIAATGRWTIES
jgi:hypothetical protein